MKHTHFWISLSILLSACTPSDKNVAEGAYAGDCNNGADDDGNGYTDCDDPGCAEDEACVDTGDADTDSDSDSDSDSDADADTDSDSDADVDPFSVLTYEVSPGSGVEFECVVLPPGSFIQGSTEASVGYQTGESQHEVTLDGSFCLGLTEVTQAQYEAATGLTPSYFSSCGENCPVETVTWHMAAAYANALSLAQHLEECFTCIGEGAAVACIPSVNPYECEGWRLPTEGEWEYATRAGDTTAFPDGGELTGTGDCNGHTVLSNGEVLDDMAWYCGDSSDRTHPVGGLEANAWGLFDMRGNLNEWVADGNGDWGTVPVSNPYNPANADQQLTRSGCWAHPVVHMRASARFATLQSTAHSQTGFRVVRSSP